MDTIAYQSVAFGRHRQGATWTRPRWKCVASLPLALLLLPILLQVVDALRSPSSERLQTQFSPLGWRDPVGEARLNELIMTCEPICTAMKRLVSDATLVATGCRNKLRAALQRRTRRYILPRSRILGISKHRINLCRWLDRPPVSDRGRHGRVEQPQATRKLVVRVVGDTLTPRPGHRETGGPALKSR